MNEVFHDQIYAFADRRTPMTLFFMVEYTVDRTEIKNVSYDGEGEVVVDSNLVFMRNEGVMPVFRVENTE